MKKFAFLLMLGQSLLWAQAFNTSETDVSLYNDLSSAYTSSFYPGVVEYASRLEEKYPDSALLSSALVRKGECLARLGQTKDAKEVLEKASRLVETDAALKAECIFWLGKTYDAEGNDEDALALYFVYCEAASSLKEKAVYFNDAVFSSGNVYYRMKAYEKAVPLYEHVVENGSSYSENDYSEAIVRLCDSYNKSGKSGKTISLYQKIKETQNANEKLNLSRKVLFLLAEYAGDAYLEQKDYRKAYDLYCEVLGSGEKSLAANALKKAYNVSSSHKKEVGTEPGAVLERAKDTLKDQPELLGEFWTRLGSDAFDDGNYEKAKAYFEEAKKIPDDRNLEYVSLYESQIACGKNPDGKSAAEAEKIILGFREGKEKLYFEREGNILLVQYYAAQEKWEEAKKLALTINPSDKTCSYYYGIACYNTGDFVTADASFGKELNEGKAISLAKEQKLKEAASVYERMKENRDLSSNEMLNYSKILLISGRYREAQIVSAKCPLNEAKYILGLAQFNTWSWPYAEESFSAFLKNGGKTESSTENKSNKSYASYAKFYLGYSQYRQSKNESAVSNLDDFVKKYPDHELIWSGYMTLANACVQLGRYDQALRYAENAVKKSDNSNREEAVLLCASIHKDAGHPDKAIAVLEPYSKLNSDFGMAALFATGRIYEDQKDYNNADSVYKTVSTSFAGKKLGEEALYRRGEMFYENQEYGKALERLSSYSSRYPNGTYLDASWYYSADCLAKTDKKDRAILQFQALMTKFPSSTYVYDSAKNLVELYREKGKYSNALENCAILLNKFGKQAEDDGIKEISIELEKLDSGATEEIVKKETEYKKSGESGTREGRHIGTDLCELYSKLPSYSARALSLSEKILAIQEKHLPEESLDASRNAMLVAGAYRAAGKNEQAGNKYLDAAKYCRQAGNADGRAQICLYSAYDAFIAAGKKGDAVSTAKSLKELYPDSVQAKKVKIE